MLPSQVPTSTARSLAVEGGHQSRRRPSSRKMRAFTLVKSLWISATVLLLASLATGKSLHEVVDSSLPISDSKPLQNEDLKHHLHDHEKSRVVSPPRFMVDLYRSMADSDVMGEIRSFRPCPGSAKGKIEFCGDAQKFSNSHRVELHLNTRKRKPLRLERTGGEMDISAGNTSAHYKKEFITYLEIGSDWKRLPLHTVRYPGWKTFDITDMVRHQIFNNNRWRISIRFESIAGRTLKPHSILRTGSSSSPFLVIFKHLNETEATSFEADFGPDNTADNDLATVAAARPRPRAKRMVEISAVTDAYRFHPNDVGLIDYGILESRDDHLSGYSDRSLNKNRASSISPESSHNSQRDQHDHYEEDDSDFPFVEDDDDGDLDDEDDISNDHASNDVLGLDYEEDDLTDSEAKQFRWTPRRSEAGKTDAILPYPKGYRGSGGAKQVKANKRRNRERRLEDDLNRKERRRRRRRKERENAGEVKKRTKDQQLPKIWKSFNAKELPLTREVRSSSCRLEPYEVDLREVGYGRRIISPKTYMANVCMGSCEFPLTQAESPTNHATLLSILSLKKSARNSIEPLPPPACCVPKKMDSLTVLYFDSDDSVVLKTYSQMAVQSCGCR